MPTIEQYLTLSVTDLKRMGYLTENATSSGRVTWRNADGSVSSQIGVMTDTRTQPYARLLYQYQGKTKDVLIPLRRVRSNLNPNAHYYLFACPETSLSCRKLYLVGGRFVSRAAFRALYRKQTVPPSKRSGLMEYTRTLDELDRMEAEPYRKQYYRGNLTRFGRKVEKLYSRAEMFCQLNA